jgi:hypothetical protein
VDLAPRPVERKVFRAAVLSIVLTLAIGPNPTLLCSVCCHSAEAIPAECQHQGATPSPRVTGEDGCRIAPADTALAREEGRRGFATAGAADAVAMPQFHVARPLTHTSRTYEPGQSHPGAASPVLIALRI